MRIVPLAVERQDVEQKLTTVCLIYEMGDSDGHLVPINGKASNGKHSTALARCHFGYRIYLEGLKFLRIDS